MGTLVDPVWAPHCVARVLPQLYHLWNMQSYRWHPCLRRECRHGRQINVCQQLSRERRWAHERNASQRRHQTMTFNELRHWTYPLDHASVSPASQNIKSLMKRAPCLRPGAEMQISYWFTYKCDPQVVVYRFRLVSMSRQLFCTGFDLPVHLA